MFLIPLMKTVNFLSTLFSCLCGVYECPLSKIKWITAMIQHSNNMNKDEQTPSVKRRATFFKWLRCGLLLVAIFYGIHKYISYRTDELDRRLELLDAKTDKSKKY